MYNQINKRNENLFHYEDDSIVSICPQCNQYLMIEIHNKKIGQIKIKCQCGYNKEIPISNYLSSLKPNNKSLIVNTCQIHDNNSSNNYCSFCNTNICSLFQKERT